MFIKPIMKKLFSVILLFLIIFETQAKKPKLVVGIVVDQMRFDYIDRFWNDFGNNGFKKLINELQVVIYKCLDMIKYFFFLNFFLKKSIKFFFDLSENPLESKKIKI